MKQGVLLLNLGGPKNLQEVKSFLYRLFSDPAILVGIPSPFRQGLAWVIAQLYGPTSCRSYQAIGGGSPQFKWTHLQAQALEERVKNKVVVGMRASSPEIMSGLKELKQWGAEEVILLPLFPQFSTTTTGSCFNEVYRCLRKLHWTVSIKEIRHWADHPNYIQLLRKTMAEINPIDQDTHILFSAHSLPLSIVRRGDPYPEDVQKTLRAVTQGLSIPWSLAYQSRNGKRPWLQPYIDDEIRRVAQLGVRTLMVVPMSFVSDHVETLWELDILYAGLARECGIQNYYRCRTFNGDPEFITVLESLARSCSCSAA